MVEFNWESPGDRSTLRISAKKVSGGNGAAVVDLQASLTEQMAAGDRISDLGESLQQERVQQAEQKVAEFSKFKKELGIAVCRLRLQAEELLQKIRVRMHSPSQPEGLLTHPEKAYLDCLEIKQDVLDRLISKDEQYWDSSL